MYSIIQLYSLKKKKTHKKIQFKIKLRLFQNLKTQCLASHKGLLLRGGWPWARSSLARPYMSRITLPHLRNDPSCFSWPVLVCLSLGWKIASAVWYMDDVSSAWAGDDLGHRVKPGIMQFCFMSQHCTSAPGSADLTESLNNGREQTPKKRWS